MIKKSDFDNALDSLHDTIPNFDVSNLLVSTSSILNTTCFGECPLSKSVQDMKVKFDKTTKQKTILGCLQAGHAHDSLIDIPIHGLGQHMLPVKYRTILRYRLIIPLFLIDKVCTVCCKTCLYTFGEHAIHCKELPDFKYKHTFVCDVLFDIFKRSGISIKKEALVNFLIDPLDRKSILKPTYVMVYGWVGGKHAYVDLIGFQQLWD